MSPFYLGELMRIFLLCLILVFIVGCKLIDGPDQQIQKMNASVNYERDMIVCVNGVCREGSIAMPLLPINKIHIYARGDLDTFIMKSCGGTLKKERAWNVTGEVKGGLFGWGSKKIEKKNEVEFEIAATDFHETGVCPLYLSGISKSGRNSDAKISWQTDEYKADGYIVCNMVKRKFEGLEDCAISTGSFTKVVFTEEMLVSPSKGCELPVTKGTTFEWRVHSGTCNYEFTGVNSDIRGMYSVYGWDEITLR